jgi:hypothetical protein
MTADPAVMTYNSAPRPSYPPRPLAAIILMLAGGSLALAFGSFGLGLTPLCLALASAGCLAFSLLIAVPAIVGAVALVFGILLLANSRSHRLAGSVVSTVSGAAIVLGVILFAWNPVTLLFVLLAFGWPVVIVLFGGILALAWKPPLRM